MTEYQLVQFVSQLGISRDQILREEAEMEFLQGLGNDRLGSRVIFYGGTALRLAYGSPRFSEGIDLVTTQKIAFSEFKKFVEKIIANRPDWKIADIKDKRQTIFTLLLITDEKLKHPFSLKIEVHKPAKKVKLETGLSLIKSPVSIAEPLLLVPTLPELKKLKGAALADRKKARDIFDLWYIAQSLRENFTLPEKMPRYQKREFENELKVFLPRKYYPVINQLYAKINPKNK